MPYLSSQKAEEEFTSVLIRKYNPDPALSAKTLLIQVLEERISSYKSHSQFLTDVSVDQSYKIKSVRQKPMKVISSDHTPRESETMEGEGLVIL